MIGNNFDVDADIDNVSAMMNNMSVTTQKWTSPRNARSIIFSNVAYVPLGSLSLFGDRDVRVPCKYSTDHLAVIDIFSKAMYERQETIEYCIVDIFNRCSIVLMDFYKYFIPMIYDHDYQHFIYDLVTNFYRHKCPLCFAIIDHNDRRVSIDLCAAELKTVNYNARTDYLVSLGDALQLCNDTNGEHHCNNDEDVLFGLIRQNIVEQFQN